MELCFFVILLFIAEILHSHIDEERHRHFGLGLLQFGLFSDSFGMLSSSTVVWCADDVICSFYFPQTVAQERNGLRKTVAIDAFLRLIY